MMAVVGALLLSHMVADYPLQTDWIAENKHGEPGAALLAHVIIHGVVTAVVVSFVATNLFAFSIACFVTVIHGLIDLADLHIRWDQTAHLASVLFLSLGGT